MGDHAELAPVMVISSYKDNFFSLHSDNLKKILRLYDGSNLDPKRIVILSIVGERNSGKSFLLNLVLQYLKSGGDGNWMNSLVKKESVMRGFGWNDLADSPGTHMKSWCHSIYMWPQPLPLEDSSGNTIWVLIMDAVKLEGSSDYGPLEELISLLSSNLIDNHRVVFKPTLLNALESVSTFQPSDYDYKLKDKAKLSPCSNITFVVTDCEDSPCGWGDKAIKYIDQNIAATVTSGSLKLIYKNLQERSACLFKKSEKTPLADKFGVLELDTALTRQIKTFASKLLGDGLSLKDFNGIETVQYFEQCVQTVNALMRQKRSRIILEPAPSIEMTPGTEIKVTKNEKESNSAQDIETKNEDVEMLDLSGEGQNCACDLNAFNPPNICVKSVGIVKEFEPHSPSHRLSIYPQLPPIVNEYQSERELPKSPVCLQRSKVDSSSFKDESTIGQKTFASSTPTPTEQGNNESACSSSSNFKAGPPSSYVSQDVRNLQYVDQKSSQNTGQTSSNGNLTSPGKFVKTVDLDELLQDTVQSIISSDVKADNHSYSSYFPSQDVRNSQFNCQKSNVQKQNSGDFSNVNIHPFEHDEIIQERVQWMKNEYRAIVNQVPKLQQENKHYQAKDIVCKKFRKFLNDIQLDSKMKGEHVQRLDKDLEREHTKMQASNKKYKQEEETAQRNVESTTNSKKASSYSTNVDDQTEDRNKETHVSNNPEAAKVCIGHILENYDQEMHKKLNLDKALEISDEKLNKSHDGVVKKLLEKLPVLLDMKHVEESGREEVKKTLDVKLELHKNEIKNNFAKIQKGLDELGKELQRELEKGMNEWVSQSTNLDRISKKSTTLLYNDCLRKVLQRAEIYRNSNYNKQNALESLFKKQTNEFLRICNKVEESLEHYRLAMTRKIEIFTCLNREKFAEFHQQFSEESEKEFKDHHFMKKIIETGIANYKSQFFERNQKIQQHEKEIAKLLIPQTINFYHMQMKALVLDQNRLFEASELDKLHTRLVEECFVAFKIACDFKLFSGLPEMKEELTNELNKLLKEYSDKNFWRVQKSSGHISKAIDEQKKAYSAQMETRLSRRGPSVNPMELVKFHEKAKVECCKILEKEIIELKLNLAIAEPIKTLNEKIQEEWNEFQRLNEQKIEKEVLKKRELEKEKVKAEAEREAREQEMAENSRKSTKANQPAEWKNAKTAMPATVAPQVPQRSNAVPSKEVKDLPPIAIQFGPKCVRLGWINDGYFESIKNIWGEEDTPFYVALTKDQKILIGTEVGNQRNLIASEFNLEDVFYEPNQNKEYECKINNSGYTEVSKEMLFALFLSRIKGDTEKDLNGQWTTAVITVPLWYSSVQRQCTKDAAEIAGFSSVYLVNETSAAALAFANESNSNGNCVLVGVQSDRHFDAAVYQYSRGKIEMISSCGDLHCSESSYAGLFNHVKNKALSMLGRGEPEILKMLNAITKSNRGFTKENIMLINISGGKIEGHIQQLFEGLGNGTSCTIEKETILFGAAYFADLLKRGDHVAKESIKDKATYKFVRQCENKHNTRSSTEVLLFSPYQSLLHLGVPCKTTIGISGVYYKEMNINFKEHSGDINFEVGKLIIPWLEKMRSVKEMHIAVSLNNEGIFKVDHVYLPGLKGTRHSLEWNWTSKNLTDIEKKRCSTVVKSLQKDEKKEALEKSSKDLQILIDQIEPQLLLLKNVFGKQILETRISEAKTQVNHSKRSQERIDSLILTLTGLRSKYLT